MKRTLLIAALTAGLAQAAFAQDISGKLALCTLQPNADAQQTVDAFKANTPVSRSSGSATAPPR